MSDVRSLKSEDGWVKGRVQEAVGGRQKRWTNDQCPKWGNSKPEYDLEWRTFQFAKAVKLFLEMVARTISNIRDTRQLVKASGSIHANRSEIIVWVIGICDLFVIWCL